LHNCLKNKKIEGCLPAPAATAPSWEAGAAEAEATEAAAEAHPVPHNAHTFVSSVF